MFSWDGWENGIFFYKKNFFLPPLEKKKIGRPFYSFSEVETYDPTVMRPSLAGE